mmetsp:Transcript_26070/g.61243  ORF Transcript_26070/g.61243 Transcript_26070/m.61243 type:complete len:460 (+) Transcript_26070:166-1545(+)
MSTQGGRIQCHYDVLGCSQDADASVIKKHHRKLVLKYHPDKNMGDDQAAEKFLLVQRAYEVLTDPQERKWYDDHRDAILAGWSASDAANNATGDRILFQVAPYMHPGCYSSYTDDKGGFFQVYQNVFEQIAACERKQSEVLIELPTNFGTSETSWLVLSIFYKSWECFSSALNFAWEDTYNAREDAPSRRVRRLMEEENNKARRTAKRAYVNDILQLVAFVKKRDPRYKAHTEEQERLKKEREQRQKEERIERKKEQQKAKEEWKEAQLREMEKAEEEDRLRGRIRLADLEDDYDYGGGKKKKKGKKKNRKSAVEESEDPWVFSGVVKEDENDKADGDADNEKGEGTEGSAPVDPESKEAENGEKATTDDASPGEEPLVEQEPLDYEEEYFSETESEEEEPESWRCEICKKDFKSEGQLQNHLKSKKHKEAVKKYQAKMKKKEAEIMAEMMEELDLDGQ